MFLRLLNLAGQTMGTRKINVQRVLRSAGKLQIATSPKTAGISSSVGDSELSLVDDIRDLDAIAAGVQTRNDLMLGLSNMVTRETAEIARGIGLPEAAIQKWIEARKRESSEKQQEIERSLTKLERSLAAQELLGLMKSYIHTEETSQKDN